MHLVKQENMKKTEVVQISSLKPYFYTRKEFHHNLITSTKKVHMLNGTFYKHEVRLPRDIRMTRPNDSYEADVKYSIRWIIDNKIDLGNEPLTKVYVDLESDNPPSRFTDFEKDRILSIAVYSDNVQKTFWLRDYESEKEMIQDFLETIKNYSCVLGWNLFGYDLPYLQTRLKVNGINPSILNKYWVWLDLMDLYKRFVTSYSRQKIVTSYSLKSVAHNEIGVEKLNKNLLFNRNKEEVSRYNLRDAELVYRIDKKLKLSDLIDAFSRISNLPPNECLYFSRIIQYMVMRELHGKWVFRNYRSTNTNFLKNFQGGMVIEPPIGIFKNIAVYDFASLYPNIIRTFNISIETLNPNGEIKTPVRQRFMKQRGIYPKILDHFMNLRSHYKNLYKKTKNEIYYTLQVGCKFLNAAFYGVLGFKSSRIYHPELAATITAIGRWLIQQVREELEKKGYSTVYGDTDSVMVQLKTDKLEEAYEVGKMINDYLESLSSEFNLTQNYLRTKLEKVFSKILFYGVKKRYFGKVVWDDGPVEKFFARGLEIRRTDWCKLAVEYEKELLRIMLDDLQKAKIFHDNFIQQIRHQPLEKFVIHKSLQKTKDEYRAKTLPLHARLARPNDWVGVKIGYIVTSTNPLEGVRYDDEVKAENVKPDYDYYLKNQIRPIYERILKPMLVKQESLTNYITIS